MLFRQAGVDKQRVFRKLEACPQEVRKINELAEHPFIC